MRFYDIAIFIICLNVSIMIIQATAIFPNFKAPVLFDVGSAANYAGNTTSIKGANDVSSFFAFIFAPITAIQMIIELLYNILFGISGIMFWMFNCTANCANMPYVGVFIWAVNAIIIILYAIAIIQILSGRYLENT